MEPPPRRLHIHEILDRLLEEFSDVGEDQHPPAPAGDPL